VKDMGKWEDVLAKYGEETVEEIIEAFKIYLKDEGYRISTKEGICSQCMDSCKTYFILCRKCFEKYQNSIQ